LLGLAGITQGLPHSQEHPRRPIHGGEPSPGQGGGYPLPAISHAGHHPGLPIKGAERDIRDTEMAGGEEVTKREPDVQNQEDQTAPTHSANVMIQQPLPLPPSIRSIHGPDGLLGNPGPMLGHNAMGANHGGSGPQPAVFGNNPAQNGGQPQSQLPNQAQHPNQLLLPSQVMMQAHGQQPILNVSLQVM
jgi:paired amphipathic helix protein Sin3a